MHSLRDWRKQKNVFSSGRLERDFNKLNLVRLDKSLVKTLTFDKKRPRFLNGKKNDDLYTTLHVKMFFLFSSSILVRKQSRKSDLSHKRSL